MLRGGLGLHDIIMNRARVIYLSYSIENIYHFTISNESMSTNRLASNLLLFLVRIFAIRKCIDDYYNTANRAKE